MRTITPANEMRGYALPVRCQLSHAKTANKHRLFLQFKLVSILARIPSYSFTYLKLGRTRCRLITVRRSQNPNR